MDRLLDFLPILLALAYVILQIFDKGKGKIKIPPKDNERSNENRADGQAYTWEDMEREYGIKIERPQEPDNQQGDGVWREDTSDSVKTQEESHRLRKQAEAEQVELARQAALQKKLSHLKERRKDYNLSSLDIIKEEEIGRTKRPSLHTLRQGIKWSMILERPKGLRK